MSGNGMSLNLAVLPQPGFLVSQAKAAFGLFVRRHPRVQDDALASSAVC